MSYLDRFLGDSRSLLDAELAGKPGLTWVDKYVRANGGEVDAHFKTHPNSTTADNLTSDIDDDGIPGYVDADVDGDGLHEAIDLDNDGIADAIADLFYF